MDDQETRRCPECGEEKRVDDFLEWHVGDVRKVVCFDCHCRLTSDSLDEFGERLRQRYGGQA